MRTRIVLIFGGLILAFGLMGCGGDSQGDARRAIVASFYPLAYLAERIAPDAEVTNITPAGAEPHDLELTARDVETVAGADLVLYLGGGFQPALERVVSGREEAIDLLDGSEGADPHVWLDPIRFAQMARAVAEAAGAPSAADDLVADLADLDQAYRTGLADCERREIVTSHAAFGRLARAYGLEQVALTGVSPEAEPSAQDVEALVRAVEQSGATTVFVEPLVSPDLAETVAREAGVETTVLDPLESLSDEAAGGGDDYLAVMRENLATLRKALGCR